MEQTLGVAHGLFAERGYADVTMDEIAGRGRGDEAAALQLLRQQGAALHRLHGAGGRLADARRSARRSPAPTAPATRSAPASAPSSPSSTPTAPPGRSSSTRRCRAAARSPTGSPPTAARSSSWSPARCSPSCPTARRDARPDRDRGALRRPARRRRGARPLVAAHRGDLRRRGGRAPDLHGRAGHPRPLAGRPLPHFAKPGKGTPKA